MKNYLLFISSLLILGCGSGSETSSPSNTNTQTNVSQDSLPFGLEKSDGSIAGGIGIYAFSAYLLPGTRVSIESINISPSSDAGPTDTIIYEEFRAPTCTSGFIDYSDNKPMAPLDIRDLGLLVYLNLNVNISALNCHLDDSIYTDDSSISDDFISGDITWTWDKSASKSETMLLTANYTNFTQISNSVYKKMKNDIVSITGNSYYRNATIEKENGEVHATLNDNYHSASLGFNMSLSNFEYQAVKEANIMSVNNFSYGVQWNMLNPNKGTAYLEDNLAENVIGLGFHKTFPEGDYDLYVKVTSPLIYKPEGNGLLIASGGAITVDLRSHNIRADIQYFEDKATVTYVRNGTTTSVTINKFGQAI